MALQIRTFDNATGGNSLFKALGHPEVSARAHQLVDDLAKAGRVAVFDPDDALADFSQLYDLSSWQVTHAFVQRLEHVGRPILGCAARSIDALEDVEIDVLLVASFDLERFQPLRHMLPRSVRVAAFDQLRLADRLLARPGRYLDSLNFATNFALFRDADGLHTRLHTANYWHRYDAQGVELWLCLFDGSGQRLAQWTEPLPDSPTPIAIDSAGVRERFGLGPFTGSLFIHALRVQGHDVVKYALDTYDDAGSVLSSTHDANAWPAERYAGLPAPRESERVLLWVQNSHPAPIPAGAIGIGRMGGDAVARFAEEIPAFATRAIDVAALLPGLRWPAQLEVHADRHFVRPRYEVVGSLGQRRIAHANVERVDLRGNPEIARLGSRLGKGFILPAPVLPPGEWRTTVLPTPMATCQNELPIQLLVYDADGSEVLRHRLGRLPRAHACALDVNDLMAEAGAVFRAGYGHLELTYDLDPGDEVDGWLHALFRYERPSSGQGAETSFGSHLYNLPIVFGNEPQSYSSRPPGLSTYLFVRLGSGDRETLCHLIYPGSGRWRPHSDTRLLLHDAAGTCIAEHSVRIPLSGSLIWRYEEVFDTAARRRAGPGYVIVRDETCRLFGYQGLLGPRGAFSLDHTFGF